MGYLAWKVKRVLETKKPYKPKAWQTVHFPIVFQTTVLGPLNLTSTSS